MERIYYISKTKFVIYLLRNDTPCTEKNDTFKTDQIAISFLNKIYLFQI